MAEGKSVPAIFKTDSKKTTPNSNKTMMKKYSGVSILLISLSLGGLMTAEEPAKAPEGRFIDAHVHFHDRNPGDLDKVAEWMKANNVQRIINHPLMQSRARDDKERAQQTENYKAYKGSMARFCIVFYDEVNSVDEAVAILTREKQAGAVGFGEHYGSAANPKPAEVVNGKPVYKSLFIDDPKSMVLFAACEKVGLPVMFHMDRGCNLDEKDFPHLQNVLKTYPKCTFIAHSDWWRSITDGSCGRLLETYPNLYADISCSVGRSPIGKDKAMAREFFIKHADKLLFGSDNGWWSFKPNAKPALEYAFIDEIKLPKDVEEKICRENAKRLFWGGRPEKTDTK